MADRHHLREVNQCQVLLFVDKQVELVEVTVHQATGCQAVDQVHGLSVDVSWVAQLTHLQNKTAQAQRDMNAGTVTVHQATSWQSG